VIHLCGFGVSNYYNKLKLILLEKQIDFEERLSYPWERESFLSKSPLGRIPYIDTDHGGISESQAILEYLEERFPKIPLYPKDIFARAKCREMIQHLELNSEWVARRLYKEAFFGGSVSEETKREAYEKLGLGLGGVARLASFSPFLLGPTLTAADCVGFMHFLMIQQASLTIFGEDLLDQHIPKAATFMRLMNERPHVQSIMADRVTAMDAFLATGVKYDG